MPLSDGISVQQVIFGERAIEISYTEPRDQAPDNSVMMVRSIAVDLNLIEEDLGDLLDTLAQIVDTGLLRVRNPPEEKRPSRR